MPRPRGDGMRRGKTAKMRIRSAGRDNLV
jgi:hypothetical protein